uniref:UDP-N-acetylglucosamine--N-acetylmuramyl-(pentapeptide) pyrophosphoryl-undecaprenol N-acetylglucosamine transferase n=1 Tax=Candidatus Kentrum sp. MB TaxID=2138164 RepID=A0A451B805_9GAMM|nr:MAG: UDP-N-acetylglucosamine-N-acetylmuramylpentapeptide N-acetylglucosamine transferase [Candidatus Kentron sp. MB]VFK27743.1 MAG: UDP-N-acetylglucosamine-N-acetylmuramylpentapeptide N-acetylglucosamine transferase [Candidatus Kentron sp. MB]VFK74416.1 MAG: UDP-N-acetylglucosamine-N-acetylmuramylpentapeptide N-acetylglucosamine transferase [Candidatus Kentron sp. MB]
MAGGTGGHVRPGLAVAEQLRAQGAQVFWLGTRRGLEAGLVPKAGFIIYFIRIAGLRGKGWLHRAMAPFLLLIAFLQSLWIIMRVRPHVVLGMGGFVSGPGGAAAWLLRRQLLIHEQNTIPGMTNRLLANLAVGVMEAFPGSFASVCGSRLRYPVQHTGNPVQHNVTSLSPPAERLRRPSHALHVLVLGGSQGAEILNKVVPDAIGKLADASSVVVRHQTGVRHAVAVQARYRGLCVAVELFPFIDNMAEAYEWADLVVSRAGAMTITELTAVGVASILVPYPFAVDDHQSKNARFLADVGAAVLIPQSELTAVGLGRLFTEFSARRSRLITMAEAARSLAIPDATQRVAMQCVNVARVCLC